MLSYFSPSGVLILVIKAYQLAISPWLPRCCRFEPTCSEYALQSLRVHGFLKGFALTVWRLMRCHPFCRGGKDPVPMKKTGSGR
ncbi:membrane protein insertion efficiency factor YidD [Lentisphaerota bacterium ZTH]|nr:membrane protein insertion efficiency factor YidD [Lentisphaerota bacterium ZTH]